MAWTNPRTWIDEEIITNGKLNEQIRDNMFCFQNKFHSEFFFEEAETDPDGFYHKNISIPENSNKGSAIIYSTYIMTGNFGIQVFFDTDINNSYGYDYYLTNRFTKYTFGDGLSDGYYGTDGDSIKLQHIYIDDGVLKISFRSSATSVDPLEYYCYYQVGW